MVIGPNGAGKTSLLRMAAAMEFPSSGTAVILGERLGRADMADLRQRIGLSSSALAQRIPDEEPVRDVVVSAGYAVLGRWREQYDVVDYLRALDTLESVGADGQVRTVHFERLSGPTEPSRRASASVS